MTDYRTLNVELISQCDILEFQLNDCKIELQRAQELTVKLTKENNLLKNLVRKSSTECASCVDYQREIESLKAKIADLDYSQKKLIQDKFFEFDVLKQRSSHEALHNRITELNCAYRNSVQAGLVECDSLKREIAELKNSNKELIQSKLTASNAWDKEKMRLEKAFQSDYDSLMLEKERLMKIVGQPVDSHIRTLRSKIDELETHNAKLRRQVNISLINGEKYKSQLNENISRTFQTHADWRERKSLNAEAVAFQSKHVT